MRFQGVCRRFVSCIHMLGIVSCLENTNLPDVSSFTGIISAFAEVEFVEVLRRSENRPIMRYFVEK